MRAADDRPAGSAGVPAAAAVDPATTVIARRVTVAGIVQGVGFRPFVYRVAVRLRLAGVVYNDPGGVVIEVEGPAAVLDALELALRAEAPPLARVDAVQATPRPVGGAVGFRIVATAARGGGQTLISPDVAVCAECLDELWAPDDRRHRYPFINCTNCGPRYTIIESLPYDRPRTVMRAFTMCPACQAEYEDPASRRFHAQPNACPDCGPRLALWTPDGAPLPDPDPVAAAVAALRHGAIVALKGLGGFHLACDASRDDVVGRLRARKHRDEKPFAIMVRDLDAAASLAAPTAGERALLTSLERPIVLCARRPGGSLGDAVAPHDQRVGIMLPYTPLHHLVLGRSGAAPGSLAAGFDGPLVMTSANPSDEPIVIDDDEAVRRLAGIADLLVVHDRPILTCADDSVVQHVAGRPRSLRRSRGFVPTPVLLPAAGPAVLAVGGELKSTVGLGRGREALLSQHLGDLENAPTFAFFEQTCAHLMRLFDVHPDVVVHDLHPDYLSTKYARALPGVHLLGVQHHHAHVLAVLAEHGRAAPVIGLAMDGTGLGTDGTMWGGEVLLVDGARCDRLAHLRPLPLPGGALAIREPWRMALALLHAAGELDQLDALLGRWPQVEPRTAHTLGALLGRGHPFVRASGLGRLFDAVAALVLGRDVARFEGQAAMMLEQAAGAGAAGVDDAPPYLFERDGLVLDPVPMVAPLLRDLFAARPVGLLAARFHATIIAALVEACAAARRDTGVGLVALGGGSFQNRLLLEGVTARLAAAGFEVLAPERVPANDGGLALGQISYAGCVSSAT